MSISLLIFSNSEYSYLWPIIEESIQPLTDLNPIFISDNTSKPKPEGFTQYIEYNSEDCYAKRWTNILPKIETDYIIVVHDVCIILNCISDTIKDAVELLEMNNIDRLSLNIFSSNNQIVGKNQLAICDLNAADIKAKTFVPFDNCPSIWKTSSYVKLWNLFGNETYRNCEMNPHLQGYCRNALKCFGLQETNDKIYYCLNRPYYNFFKILHITIQGEITYPVEVYGDMKDDFINIFEKHSLKNKIKINNSYGNLLTDRP